MARPHTPAFGCSTKWKSKIESQMKELQRIESEPVTVQAANADDLRKLRQNETGKVLLVNFWLHGAGPASKSSHKLKRRGACTAAGILSW
jgi:hypothetical protein